MKSNSVYNFLQYFADASTNATRSHY